ncbi:hypothetical protein LCGC14_0812710 [marine sediment metagenome]|uniref:Uncharacterized protein n=1 Tax=marine sediment metagenome TaxID=412755 RepID=A0A0F9Q6D2_9ZZZZ
MPQLRKDQLAAIIMNEEMLATPLLVLCIDAFGTDFFEWEPETFDIETRRVFGAALSDVNRDKVWALVTVLTTDLFYKSLETFIPVCNSLNGSEADFDDYDPVTSEEAAWGIIETQLVDPPAQGKSVGQRFSHEIRRYVGLTLKSEGVTTPPKAVADVPEYDRDPEEETGIVIGPDEGMLQMHERRQQAEREAIDDYVRGRLDDLAMQLQSLPLLHGQTGQIAQGLQSMRASLTMSPTPEKSAPAIL